MRVKIESAALLVLSLVSLLFLAAASQPTKQRQTEKTDQHDAAAPSTTAPPAKASQPAYRPYTKYNPDPCYHAQDHDAADLCAQWRAAIAAEKSAHEARRATNWSIAATAISAIGMGFIAWSLLQTQGSLEQSRRSNLIAQKANARATRRAIEGASDTAKALAIAERNANAADRQVTNSESSTKRQLRAYVNVTRIKIVTNEAGKITDVVIFYANSGQTPAVDCDAYFRMYQTRGANRHFEIDTPISDEIQPKIIVPNGPEFNKMISMIGFEDIIPNIMSGEVVVFVKGWIKYKDIFGDPHATHFQAFCDKGNIVSRGFSFAPNGNYAV